MSFFSRADVQAIINDITCYTYVIHLMFIVTISDPPDECFDASHKFSHTSLFFKPSAKTIFLKSEIMTFQISNLIISKLYDFFRPGMQI